VPTSHLKDIRIQPIYFIAGMLLGIVCTYGPAILAGQIYLPV